MMAAGKISEKIKKDVVVIGGGPAGLAAAIAAREAGCGNLLLIERDISLGGILNQCIHDGFGLHRFKEALSGPEYSQRYIDRLQELQVPVALDSIVLSMDSDKRLLVSKSGSLTQIEARSIVLATGCRERPRGALSIPGHRPAGVYTAGAAQTFVNMENIKPGNRVVILGSGDIGLIMARRMTLEGARVEAVFELLPYSSGLPRNIQQCLVDYGIPLFLGTTIVDIVGMERLEGVVAAEVDSRRTLVKGTERFVPCDTLLLSVGLIPENELAREAGIQIHPVTGGAVVDDSCMTSVPGIFSCGNALHVHDLVDWVSEEAARAGANAAAYVKNAGAEFAKESVAVSPGAGVRYVLPQTVRAGHDALLALRVEKPLRAGIMEICSDGAVIKTEQFARLHPAEMVHISLEGEKIRERTPLEVRVRL